MDRSALLPDRRLVGVPVGETRHRVQPVAEVVEPLPVVVVGGPVHRAAVPVRPEECVAQATPEDDVPAPGRFADAFAPLLVDS